MSLFDVTWDILKYPLIVSLLIASIMLLVMLISIYLYKINKKYYPNFSIFLSLEMLGMNLALYSYFLSFNILNLLLISASFMFGGIFIFFKEFKKSAILSLIFSIILTISEVAMGSLIYVIYFRNSINFIDSIGSPWFVYVMFIEMVYSLIISFKMLDKIRKQYFLIFILLMPLFPNLYIQFHTIIWMTSLIMIIATVMIFDTLYRNRSKKGSEIFLSLEMMGIFTIMMGGEFYYFLTGSWNIYFLSMAIGMIWFLYRIFQEPTRKGNYLTSSSISLTLVVMTFIMEWFMGAVLEFNNGQFGTGLAGFVNSLSLGWISSFNPISVLFDLVSVIVTVTASVWFLIMMGLEMGFLAFRKIIDSRVRENKVRLGLMISAYAIYSVYIPSFSPLSSRLEYIPYMWSMGIGTNGPVTSSVLIALIGTYIISAILSFLFGSRQVCSVTCTAPLMYQGTFYDSLKKFNRTTKIGRKTLTSKIKGWFKFVVIFVNIIVLATAIISFLDYKGNLNWYIYGNDPSVVVYAFMFNFVWYLGFVMSPFMGTYACVNQGWCYWGTFNQAIGRLGFFRLKVRDTNACLNCKTVDCANACPVGITDMRGSFISKGEFKSFKCIGVGDCVEACPYDNIFFYDVRHAIKNKFQKNSS